jgi:hypothetical protein
LDPFQLAEDAIVDIDAIWRNVSRILRQRF